jgi:hypothetical protein
VNGNQQIVDFAANLDCIIIIFEFGGSELDNNFLSHSSSQQSSLFIVDTKIFRGRREDDESLTGRRSIDDGQHLCGLRPRR